MSTEGPTTAGSIDAKLKLDGDQFILGINEALEKTEKLDGKTAEVHIKEAGAAETAAKMAALDEEVKKVGKDAQSSGDQQGGALAAVLPLIGPVLGATVALGAAYTGLAVAAGAMGAAGIVAIKGIASEMQQGTDLGNHYSAALQDLKGDLDYIAHTGAVVVLSGFDQAVAAVNNHMPILNTLTQEMGTALGDIVGRTLNAFLDGLQAMHPLIQLGANALSQFVGWLDQMATSDGFTSFVQYAIANLPTAMGFLQNLITFVGNLIAAFAPMGPVVLGALNGLVQLLNAIPTPVLATVTSLALGAFGAFKLWGSLAPIIDGVAAAIGGVEVVTSLAIPVVGIITAAITAFVIAQSQAADANQAAAAAMSNYTEAVKQDNDAIGENVRSKVAQALADNDILKLGQQLGISTKDMIGYVEGETAARDNVNQKLAEQQAKVDDLSQGYTDANSGTHLMSQSQSDLSDKLNKVRDGLNAQNGGLQKALESQRLYNEALKQGNQAVQDYNPALTAEAQWLGTTVPALQAATAAQDQQGTSTANATLQMQLQNNAAGLLTNALNALNVGSLNLAQAQTNSAKATNSVTQSFAQNGVVIDGNTDQVLANQSAIQQKVQADQAQAKATADATQSTEQAVQKYRGEKQALEDNLAAHHMLTPAVQEYIDKLYDIADFHPAPTKIEVDASQAKAELAAVAGLEARLQDRTIHLTTVNDTLTGNSSVSTTGTNVGNGGAPQAYALGGYVGYLASGGYDPYARGTDTVHAMLTPGEHVMSRPAATTLERDHPGVLAYMNRTGQLPQSGGTAPVYLTANFVNPFTGEQVRATVQAVAQQEIGSAFRNLSAMRPGI